jgi:hypothetical protein
VSKFKQNQCPDTGHSLRQGLRLKKQLFRFVLFFLTVQKTARLFDVHVGSVYGELVLACVFGDGEDALYGVAVVAECLDEKVDIYHG